MPHERKLGYPIDTRRELEGGVTNRAAALRPARCRACFMFGACRAVVATLESEQGKEGKKKKNPPDKHM
jgi:hypothetical protein